MAFALFSTKGSWLGTLRCRSPQDERAMQTLSRGFLLGGVGVASSLFLDGLPLSFTSSAVARNMGNGGGAGGMGEAPGLPPGSAA